MLVDLNFNYSGRIIAIMKLNAKIARSLHLQRGPVVRSVAIRLSRRLKWCEAAVQSAGASSNLNLKLLDDEIIFFHQARKMMFGLIRRNIIFPAKSETIIGLKL
jgi:hypothetical protein